MRRLISISLLLVFGLPLISPLFALGSSPESTLPACCRRAGAHHCTMSAEEIARLEHGRNFAVVHSKCPLYPTASVTLHPQQLSFHPAPLLIAEMYSHPARVHQVEAWARAALEGARHKRGPPTPSLS